MRLKRRRGTARRPRGEKTLGEKEWGATASSAPFTNSSHRKVVPQFRALTLGHSQLVSVAEIKRMLGHWQSSSSFVLKAVRESGEVGKGRCWNCNAIVAGMSFNDLSFPPAKVAEVGKGEFLTWKC